MTTQDRGGDETALSVLEGSGMVHPRWYMRSYPDAAHSGIGAAEHYLRLGDAMGRSPGGSFDAPFYRETSADLIAPGETALGSYLRVGRDMGRPARARGSQREIARLARHLWGGLPGPAADALTRIAEDPHQGQPARREALCALASRRHFDGDLEGAAALLDRVREVAPDQAGTRAVLVRRGMLAVEMGDPDLARRCFGTVRDWAPGDDVLAASLVEDDDSARLGIVSAGYRRAGLAGLRLRDPVAPLGLGNIRGDAPPPGIQGMGRVSVILPAYQAEARLETALRSLLEQTYRDLEILVVDDRSTDGTHALAQRIASEDGRVRVLRASRNGGPYAARNIGLGAATGAFVTTHDADDWSHPQKIEWQLRAFNRDPSALATAVIWARAGADLRMTTSWRLDDRIAHIGYSSFMLRRRAMDVLGPWDEVRAGADAELVWRLEARFGASAFHRVASGMPLAFALDESGSLTRAGASHIVTEYHGLRQAYREVARRHLAVPDGAPPPEGGRGRFGSAERKMARVPAELRGGALDEAALDLEISGDLFDEGDAGRIAAFLSGPDAPRRTGLLHAPRLESEARRFAPALWEVLDGERVVLLVPGLHGGKAARRLRACDLDVPGRDG